MRYVDILLDDVYGTCDPYFPSLVNAHVHAQVWSISRRRKSSERRRVVGEGEVVREEE